MTARPHWTPGGGPPRARRPLDRGWAGAWPLAGQMHGWIPVTVVRRPANMVGIMPTLTDHLIKLTDHRDRDPLDLTLAKALLDLTVIQRVVIARLMVD